MNYECQDLENICQSLYIDWDKFYEKTILISGATGLIGTIFVNSIAYTNRERDLNIRIICLVRDIEKAKKRLDNDVVLFVSSLEEEIEINEPIDFIIHAASPTDSSFFINNPVETINIAIKSTTNMLELAKKNKLEGFVYLSSMEVYGRPEKEHLVTEDEVAGFNTMVTRNCYPQSKQICEMLCKAYQNEYDVPTMVVRLTQTFGPGVAYDDGRVFAQFMRCVLEGKDIILHTSGKTERCYLYTADAVTAILTVLTKGTPGNVYTAANIETYCSIAEMANMVASKIADNKIKVKVVIDGKSYGYAPELYMMLDTSKLESLGWKASVDLEEAYRRMINTMRIREVAE